jgi:RHS repeat-associated protein
LLEDAVGATTDAYDYDAFGILIYRSGTTPNDYLYRGEQFDANLGFYYLRARYLNPSSGRFFTMDSFEGGQYDPLSLHKYTYVNGDPANRLDPTGNASISEVCQVAVVATVLANLAIFSLSFASAAMHDFKIDGGLVSFRGNFNYRGATIGGGADLIWQRSTRRWFFAMTGEVGTAPVSIFKKQRGLGFSATAGVIIGMNDPSEMSGAAATAIVPASIALLLPNALFSENKAWGAMTQLAKRNANISYTDVAFSVGLSSSGPSFATVGLRSNAFSSVFSYTGQYHPAEPVVQELRDTVGPLFDVMEAGMFDSADNIRSNAQSIVSAMRASNQN